MIREFSEKEIKPLAQDIDKNSTFPKDTADKLAKLGLMGIPWPSKYGGGEMDNLSLVIVIEEIAKVCVLTVVTLMAHTSLARSLYLFGNEDQKNNYLRKLS